MNHNIDTLVIIGNGFDVWQGLNTRYSQFKEYYLLNRKRIKDQLHIKEKYYLDSDGNKQYFTDVELIYGNPFHPVELEDQFWGAFETSLENIDAEAVNLLFGKSRAGLSEMKKSVRNAKKILTTAFCEWIASISLSEKASSHRFGDNCVFINFNYTDTLSRVFKVDGSRIYHIHGEATDKKSIIFGHSSHPHLPEQMLYRFGGRFRGLFFIEQLLYETDKHVQDNIHSLCVFFALHGINADGIKKVYVHGHSMSLPDIEYFQFISEATRIGDPNGTAKSEHQDKSDPIDELHHRIQYSVTKTGYGKSLYEIEGADTEAVERQFNKEQNAKDSILRNGFEKMLRKHFHQPTPKDIAYSPYRTHDAEWHISYFSEKDKIWAEALMKEFGRKNYFLYPSIDDCLTSMTNAGSN